MISHTSAWNKSAPQVLPNKGANSIDFWQPTLNVYLAILV